MQMKFLNENKRERERNTKMTWERDIHFYDDEIESWKHCYLRTAADPGVIFRRDKFAYWARALARCAAFESTADMLLKLAATALAKHKNGYD